MFPYHFTTTSDLRADAISLPYHPTFYSTSQDAHLYLSWASVYKEEFLRQQ